MTASARESRLFVRTDRSEKQRIELAARLARQTVSDFVRVAVEDRAEDVIATQFQTRLSADDFSAFHAALDAPDEPNEARRRITDSEPRFIQK